MASHEQAMSVYRTRSGRVFEPWRMAVLLEVERLRLRAGMSCEALAERAGISERGYNKYTRPYSPGGAGRVPDDGIIAALAGAVGSTIPSLLLVAFKRWGSISELTRETYERRLVSMAMRYHRDRHVVSPFSKVWARAAELSALGVAARRAKMTAEDRRRVAAAGGRARATKLSDARRQQIARHASHVRWAKVRQDGTIPHAVSKHT
jgi:transcriptional regulator with XRE-family HTH domain